MGFSEIVKFQAKQSVFVSLFHRTEVTFSEIFMCKTYFVFRCRTEFSSRPSYGSCFPSTVIPGRALEALRDMEPCFVGVCLVNCRPSSYCDNQTTNFQNCPLGGDAAPWRSMWENGQQAPESGLWSLIPIPSSSSSCVALVKSLDRLQLIFKMERTLSPWDCWKVKWDNVSWVPGPQCVPCVSSVIGTSSCSPSCPGPFLLSVFCFLKRQRLLSLLWGGYGFPLGHCLVSKEASLLSSFFREGQQAWRPGGIERCQEPLRNSFWPAGNWSVHRNWKEKLKHKAKCMRNYVDLPISY